MDHHTYYSELISRNRHFIDLQTQQQLSQLKILIAGCGSVGGACTESLTRVGVLNFILADNGTFELTNLNRQKANFSDVGVNKALVHQDRIQKINTHTNVQVFTEGLNIQNVDSIISWADIVIDGVDVTTADGMQNKLLLHEKAFHYKKPVFTMLDLGYCQWGRSYDYRSLKAPLEGKLKLAQEKQNPIAALFSFISLESVPNHVLPLVHEVLLDPKISASQLICAADLLSAVMVSAVIRYAKDGKIIEGWNLDLSENVYSEKEKKHFQESAQILRRKISEAISSLK